MWTSDDKRFGRKSKVYLIHPRLILHTEFLHQKRQTTWSQAWKSSRMQRIPYGESTCKEMPQKRNMMASDRNIRDKAFRKAMIEIGRTEQMIVEMDKLSNEDHRYKASREEIEFYRGNWWIHSNLARVDSIPTRYEPEF